MENLTERELIAYCLENKIQAVIPTRDGELPYFAAAREALAESGIRVMVSSPEAIEVCVDKLAFYERAREEHPEVLERALATSPLGRLGDPEIDIGRAVVFLASSDSDFITGQTVWVDGGNTIHS